MGSRPGAMVAPELAGGRYAGCTSSPSAVLASSAPTGDTPDVLTLTFRAAVGASVPAGTYSSVIHYVVSPNY